MSKRAEAPAEAYPPLHHDSSSVYSEGPKRLARSANHRPSRPGAREAAEVQGGEIKGGELLGYGIGGTSWDASSRELSNRIGEEGNQSEGWEESVARRIEFVPSPSHRLMRGGKVIIVYIVSPRS